MRTTCNNLAARIASPPLTSITPDGRKIGPLACRILARLFGGEGSGPESIHLSGQNYILHIRENTVGPAGLSQSIPFHTACAWTPDSYDFRSAATIGLIAQFDYLALVWFFPDCRQDVLTEGAKSGRLWLGDWLIEQERLHEGCRWRSEGGHFVVEGLEIE